MTSPLVAATQPVPSSSKGQYLEITSDNKRLITTPNKPGSFAQWMDVRAACRITGNHVKRDEKESSFSYTCEPPIGHITGTVQLRTDNG